MNVSTTWSNEIRKVKGDPKKKHQKQEIAQIMCTGVSYKQNNCKTTLPSARHKWSVVLSSVLQCRIALHLYSVFKCCGVRQCVAVRWSVLRYYLQQSYIIHRQLRHTKLSWRVMQCRTALMCCVLHRKASECVKVPLQTITYGQLLCPGQHQKAYTPQHLPLYQHPRTRAYQLPTWCAHLPTFLAPFMCVCAGGQGGSCGCINTYIYMF